MTMTPMEPFESAAHLNEDIGLFEAATHAAPVEIADPRATTIVAVLDGSDQDQSVRDLAEAMAGGLGAGIEVVAGRPGVAEILSATAAQPGSLLVLPVPCGEDYRQLGNDSLGSVADQVLLKSTCPVLCVREPLEAAGIPAALERIVVPVVHADEHAQRALGWAFQLTAAGGRIDLVAIADRSALSESSHLLPDGSDVARLDADQLSRAVTRDIGGLTSAAQKRAGSTGRTLHVETRVGQFVPLVLAELHGHPQLVICGTDREHSSPAFHRMVDLLAASAGPVLIV